MCTVCIAKNTQACARAVQGPRPQARAHTHIHTRYTHIQTHTGPGGGSDSARQREPLRKRETSRRVQHRCSSYAPAGVGSHPQLAGSAGPGYLCCILANRPGLPPLPHFPTPGCAPYTQQQQLLELVRVCFVLELLPSRPAAGATSLDAAQASPVLVSFFYLTLARRTFAPIPVPDCDFSPSSSRGGEGGKLLPQPQLTEGQSGCDLRQILAGRLGRIPDLTLLLVILLHFTL